MQAPLLLPTLRLATHVENELVVTPKAIRVIQAGLERDVPQSIGPAPRSAVHVTPPAQAIEPVAPAVVRVATVLPLQRSGPAEDQHRHVCVLDHLLTDPAQGWTHDPASEDHTGSVRPLMQVVDYAHDGPPIWLGSGCLFSFFLSAGDGCRL